MKLTPYSVYWDWDTYSYYWFGASLLETSFGDVLYFAPYTPDCDHCCHFSRTTYLKFPINICLASVESVRSKRIGICGAYRWDGSD